MKRSTLRAYVIEVSGGWCEWPYCTNPGTEMAHIHSIGMGGRPSADHPDNVAWMCYDHARISDGEYGHGGELQYLEEHLKLLGKPPSDDPGSRRVAYLRAEALTAHLKRTRIGRAN